MNVKFIPNFKNSQTGYLALLVANHFALIHERCKVIEGGKKRMVDTRKTRGGPIGPVQAAARFERSSSPMY